MSEIKRAFRKKSLQYHPDKDSSEEAKEMFAAVRHAYEIVGDDDKRMLFDTGGMELVEQTAKEDERRQHRPQNPIASMFGYDDSTEPRQANKGPDSHVKLEVTLENLYNGAELKPRVRRRIICRGCKKNPQKEKCKKCNRCPNELRTVIRTVGPGFRVQQQEEVPSKHKCKLETTELAVTVEKGMKESNTITFERMAEQSPGMIPGDIVWVLSVKPHRMFRREGDDLHMTVKISLRDALIGFEKTTKHLDGHKVTIVSDSVISHGDVKKIKGEGMPRHQFPSEFGDLFVKFVIIMPKKLTDEEKDFVRTHFDG